jgi:two-component system, cell cycle sensor histidine kinase and response regulator CckA
MSNQLNNTNASDHKLDDLVFLATQLCTVPIAFISFADKKQFRVLSSVGLDTNEVSLDPLCNYLATKSDLSIVADTLTDERFLDSLPVMQSPHIRFFAGLPLITSHGETIGTLTVADRNPRSLTISQQESLRVLSNQVIDHLELKQKSLNEVANSKQKDLLDSISLVLESEQRKKAEEALQRSEACYKDLVENASDMIFTHDLAGRYLSLNRAGEIITGYKADEILQMSIFNIIAPEYIEMARQMITQKIIGGGESVYNLEIITKNGKRVALEVNSWIIYEGTTPVGVRGIARDVTERKQLETQLRQAQKMEAVGRLAGGIAHDFNNLLTAITGYSDLMLMRLRPEEPLQRNAKEIKKAAMRAASLTQQLLAFSRQQVLQPKVIDLNNVISDMENMIRRLIGEDIELVTTLGTSLNKVKADIGQIEQVILNLAVNARDAMPKGGQLIIETQNALLDEEIADRYSYVQTGSYVLIRVTDTGCGMDADTQARIFEPFFTTKEKGKGTGLGLSTVYGIVKQSGGYIWVTSEPGLGTTFSIYLPQATEEAEIIEQHPITIKQFQPNETILITEDEEVVRKLVRAILEMHGYKVLEARHGVEALSICEQYANPIHLLITDMVMPQMNGPELAERLFTLRPETRILFMSGYTDPEIIGHDVSEAKTPFMQKPFTAEILERKVREVLDQIRDVDDIVYT